MKESWKEKLQYKTHFYMDLGWRTQYVGVLETEYEGVTFYFIDNEFYFNGFAPYGEMYTDVEKFSFFSKAVLSALPVIDFRPDIIHCHDWQTGLIPIFLDNFRYSNEYYRGIKTVMTIHNLKFQGMWDAKKVKEREILPFSENFYSPEHLFGIPFRCEVPDNYVLYPALNRHICRLFYFFHSFCQLLRIPPFSSTTEKQK